MIICKDLINPRRYNDLTFERKYSNWLLWPLSGESVCITEGDKLHTKQSTAKSSTDKTTTQRTPAAEATTTTSHQLQVCKVTRQQSYQVWPYKGVWESHQLSVLWHADCTLLALFHSVQSTRGSGLQTCRTRQSSSQCAYQTTQNMHTHQKGNASISSSGLLNCLW